VRPTTPGTAAPPGTRARGRWRPTTIPEQLGLLGLACAAASFAYPPLHQAVGLRFICPLRELTGVPCPLCGLTTASTALAGGDLSASLAANPFALPLAIGTAMMAVLMVCRALGVAAPARRWGRRAQRTTVVIVAALAAVSWAVQLRRYGLI
jgi:hypothetical protein